MMKLPWIILWRSDLQYELNVLEQTKKKCVGDADVYIDGKIRVYKKLLGLKF